MFCETDLSYDIIRQLNWNLPDWWIQLWICKCEHRGGTSQNALDKGKSLQLPAKTQIFQLTKEDTAVTCKNTNISDDKRSHCSCLKTQKDELTWTHFRPITHYTRFWVFTSIFEGFRVYAWFLLWLPLVTKIFRFLQPR